MPAILDDAAGLDVTINGNGASIRRSDAAGTAVGQALLRFDLRSDLLKFLRSFQLERG